MYIPKPDSRTGQTFADSIQVQFAVFENGGISIPKVNVISGTAVSGSPIEASTQQVSGLESNTSHTAVLHSGNFRGFRFRSLISPHGFFRAPLATSMKWAPWPCR